MASIQRFGHTYELGVTSLRRPLIERRSATFPSTEIDGELIVLLAGGDKSTQKQDIKEAISLAKNLQEYSK